MSSEILFCIFFVWVCFNECKGITRSDENQKNLIGEEDRRGVNVKEDSDNNDEKKAETKKRGLWVIGQANRHPYPSGYDSTGTGGGYQGYSGQAGVGGYAGHTGPGGYVGHTGAGGYGGAAGLTGAGGYSITGSGYTYENSALGYHKGSTFAHGYGPSGGGSSFGYGNSGYGHTGSGTNFGHSGSGYEEPEHGGVSHGNDIHKKLALKKFLIPLAGLALLGAAAALSTNPVLLQLGTINGRRRRSIFEKSYRDVYPINPKVRPEFTN